jgi:hypothetical protein
VFRTIGSEEISSPLLRDTMILERETISLGKLRGPTPGGKEKHTPGISGSQGELESLATVRGVNRIEGLCGMAEGVPLLPHPQDAGITR